MPNGLLILFTFAIYGLFVYGPSIARYIGRKRKIIGKPYKNVLEITGRNNTTITCSHSIDAAIGDKVIITSGRWKR